MHQPVLLDEVLGLLQDSPRPIKSFMDGTFGRGGHCMAICEQHEGLQVIAVDQDQEALDYGRAEVQPRFPNIHFCKAKFDDVERIQDFAEAQINTRHFDAILIDLGVSSPQLDTPERGFSFYHDGPLDMRMDLQSEFTAADIVNDWDEEDLIDLFQSYGEVRRPHKAVEAIVDRRRQAPFSKTLELANLIEKSMGWRKKGHHPATSFFLALRMKVNNEIEPLAESVRKLSGLLNPGGRLLVITFHSLEDRIVKYLFKDLRAEGVILTKKVIKPSREEIKANKRARSAFLRAFQRGELQ